MFRCRQIGRASDTVVCAGDSLAHSQNVVGVLGPGRQQSRHVSMACEQAQDIHVKWPVSSPAQVRPLYFFRDAYRGVVTLFAVREDAIPCF